VEATGRLGGQLRRAAEAPFFENVAATRQPFERFVAGLTAQLEELGVKVEMGRRLRAQDISAYRPNVVVVATGARYRLGLGPIVALSRPLWPLLGRSRPSGPLVRAVKDWLLKRARRSDAAFGGPLTPPAGEAGEVAVHRVGDCREPSGTRDAIRRATDVGCGI
jgi:hypothetical protein